VSPPQPTSGSGERSVRRKSSPKWVGAAALAENGFWCIWIELERTHLMAKNGYFSHFATSFTILNKRLRAYFVPVTVKTVVNFFHSAFRAMPPQAHRLRLWTLYRVS